MAVLLVVVLREVRVRLALPLPLLARLTRLSGPLLAWQARLLILWSHGDRVAALLLLT